MDRTSRAARPSVSTRPSDPARHGRSVRLSLLGAVALAATVVFPSPGAQAGCLAPADRAVDGSGTFGPVAGNAAGDMVYTRDLLGTGASLILAPGTGGQTEIAEVGDTSSLRFMGEAQTWAAFHAAALNSDGDTAFVASTTIPDDPGTPGNENLAHRGCFVRQGNTITEIGRFGTDSPSRDGFGQPIPWGGFFDVALLDRDGMDADVVFVGQYGAGDSRIGVFRWSDASGLVTPIVLQNETVLSLGTAFQSIGRMRGNGAGDIVFAATTQAGPEDPLVGGLFVERNGGTLQRVITTTGPNSTDAPGGGKFSRVIDFGVAGDGAIVFAGEVVGGAAPSGLYRAAPPLYAPSALALEGDATDLGAPLGEFRLALVRVAPDGEIGLAVPLGDGDLGTGLLTLPSGATDLVALSNPGDVFGLASFGGGRLGYQTPDTTRRVSPADGSEEGQADFRLIKLDLRNLKPLRADSLKLQAAFRLPAQGDGMDETSPVVFRTQGVTRYHADEAFTGAALTRIAEIHVSLSTGPGNNFVFGVNGDAGTATLTYNNLPQDAPSLKLDSTGAVATVKYKTPVGRGKVTVDLRRQTVKFTLSAGTIRESFLATGFRVHFELRSADDLANGREGEDALFHYDERIDASAPNLRGGARVVSKGTNPPGGLLFVDTLQVKRKLKASKGQAAPIVTSDAVKAAGQVRICPGASLPNTPTLSGDVQIGDLLLEGITLVRKGGGARYQFKSAKGTTPSVKLLVDAGKGTWTLRAKGVTPLSQLVDADFSGSSATNDSKLEVGGMTLPFRLRVDRLYELTRDIPVVRRKKGKVFER